MLDTMTLTKVVGAFCGELLIFLLGSWLGEALYHGGGHTETEQAYLIDTGDTEEAEPDQEIDMLALVQQADASAGERGFRQCAACHKIEEPVNSIGPHLDGVMGREIASISDYTYSGALPAGEIWTLDHMSEWLTKPSDFAKGTTMSFKGIAKDKDRADMIAYLISMSPDYTLPEN